MMADGLSERVRCIDDYVEVREQGEFLLIGQGSDDGRERSDVGGHAARTHLACDADAGLDTRVRQANRELFTFSCSAEQKYAHYSADSDPDVFSAAAISAFFS
jgi:hypothetical protein